MNRGPQSQFRGAVNRRYFKNSITMVTRIVKVENCSGLSFIYFIRSADPTRRDGQRVQVINVVLKDRNKCTVVYRGRGGIACTTWTCTEAAVVAIDV